MFFEHVFDKGLAQSSYILGCQATGDAIVIDPKRDIDDYLEIAEREKLSIKNVAETHIHADFLSGARELAAATGAEILLSDEGGEDWQYQFEHQGLHDKDEFYVGNLKFQVMYTPGHTPEHISFLLTDTAASTRPIMVFTGDFVFVGDIGRPDLLEEAAGIKGTREVGAKQMFESLNGFKQLPDYVQVWPAHGAGSASGKALGAVPSTTVGYEKIVCWAFRIDELTRKLIRIGLDNAYGYLPDIEVWSNAGHELETLDQVTTSNLYEKLNDNEVQVLDVRGKSEYDSAHVPNAENIHAGYILDRINEVPEGRTVVVHCESRDRSSIAASLLQSKGFENITNLTGGIAAWKQEGYPVEKTKKEEFQEA